jgi:hypothetical protein
MTDPIDDIRMRQGTTVAGRTRGKMVPGVIIVLVMIAIVVAVKTCGG